MAVQKWRYYLMRKHFIINTDQKNLKFLTEQRLISEEQFRWVSKLLGFDFEIRYKPGCDNLVADVLSRKGLLLQFLNSTLLILMSGLIKYNKMQQLGR